MKTGFSELTPLGAQRVIFRENSRENSCKGILNSEKNPGK